MQTYLYQFNWPPAQKDLCKLEAKYLFNVDLEDKILITSTNICVDTSVFIKAKIDIYCCEESESILLDKLKQQNIQLDSYKVIYLKNETTHIDYEYSLKMCNQVSKCFTGKIQMKEPETTIAITNVNNIWYVGKYYHGIPSWRNYMKKPYTFSNALDLRLARTVVNIAAKNDPTRSIIDPCCGMAGVVLEGLALGYTICGFDISREVSYKGRLNVEYYGYDPMLINRSDIKDIQGHYDVAIIDIPYNLYAPITHQQQCDILSAARKICDMFILISYDDMTKEVCEAGFTIEDYCVVKKTEFTSFERKIFVCK